MSKEKIYNLILKYRMGIMAAILLTAILVFPVRYFFDCAFGPGSGIDMPIFLTVLFVMDVLTCVMFQYLYKVRTEVKTSQKLAFLFLIYLGCVSVLYGEIAFGFLLLILILPIIPYFVVAFVIFLLFASFLILGVLYLVKVILGAKIKKIMFFVWGVDILLSLCLICFTYATAMQ